jgi:hypothetical protein
MTGKNLGDGVLTDISAVGCIFLTTPPVAAASSVVVVVVVIIS